MRSLTIKKWVVLRYSNFNPFKSTKSNKIIVKQQQRYWKMIKKFKTLESLELKKYEIQFFVSSYCLTTNSICARSKCHRSCDANRLPRATPTLLWLWMAPNRDRKPPTPSPFANEVQLRTMPNYDPSTVQPRTTSPTPSLVCTTKIPYNKC